MYLLDVLGLIGVALLLLAYGLGVADRLDPKGPPALLLNLGGALLILASLWKDFNLSAVVIETAWALIALTGLARYALARRRAPRS